MTTEAKAVWLDNQRFAAESSSRHAIVLDGDKKTANSPMELVLMGLCGCTGYDVASILRKKREPFTSLFDVTYQQYTQNLLTWLAEPRRSEA